MRPFAALTVVTALTASFVAAPFSEAAAQGGLSVAIGQVAEEVGEEVGSLADPIVAAIDAVEFPKYDAARRGEDGYMEDFFAKREAASAKISELTLKLWGAEPEHEKLIKLFPQRWGGMAREADTRADALAEIEAVIARHSDGEMAEMAMYQCANVQMYAGDTAALQKAVRAFRDAFPENELGGRLLGSMAGQLPPDEAVAAWREVIEAFPDGRSTKYAYGKVRQVEQMGKPFELEFTDAVSGDVVSMETLKGKVVVVDFWATWCGPCIADMPNMKELYAEFASQGVEFVGISLDSPPEDGGLDKLKAYVADNDVPWPQYYQGNGWAGEFSVSWGINSIPALFVVDAKGNLVSVSARGQLDSLLPELLGQVE